MALLPVACISHPLSFPVYRHITVPERWTGEEWAEFPGRDVDIWIRCLAPFRWLMIEPPGGSPFFAEAYCRLGDYAGVAIMDGTGRISAIEWIRYDSERIQSAVTVSDLLDVPAERKSALALAWYLADRIEAGWRLVPTPGVQQDHQVLSVVRELCNEAEIDEDVSREPIAISFGIATDRRLDAIQSRNAGPEEGAAVRKSISQLASTTALSCRVAVQYFRDVVRSCSEFDMTTDELARLFGSPALSSDADVAVLAAEAELIADRIPCIPEDSKGFTFNPARPQATISSISLARFVGIEIEDDE
jgi:hypothetical protein